MDARDSNLDAEQAVDTPAVPQARAAARAVRRFGVPTAAGAFIAAAIVLASVIVAWGKAGARSNEGERVATMGLIAATADVPVTATPHSEVAAAAVAPAAAAVPTTATTVPVSAASQEPTIADATTTSQQATTADTPITDAAAADATATPIDAPSPQPTHSIPIEVGPPPPGTRDKRLWPFAVDSIWNMPIGANAAYVPAGIGPPSLLTIDAEYFVFPGPSDPVRPVYTNRIWGKGRCTPTTFQYTINLPDAFQVPDATQNFTPNDVAAILASDGRTLKQMNPVSRCAQGGPLTAGWLAPDQDIYGPGILGGHGGSGLSSIGGSIRQGELTGTEPIRHALKVNLWGGRWLSETDGGYRWPAVTADSYFADLTTPNAYGGGLPQLRMGALLAIPGDIDINALGLQTPAAQKLAWTIQNYGAYVVDDTASDSFALDVEAGVDDEFRAAYGYDIEAMAGPWYDDMMKIVGLLAIVDNNGPTSIGGGGAPRQPLAPPIGN